MIYCFISDMMFQSQVQVAANAMNIPIQFVRSIEEVIKPISLAVFDLSFGDVSSLELFRQSFPNAKTIAFLPHVEKEIREKANAIGCSEVISRFEFSKNLRDILSLNT